MGGGGLLLFRDYVSSCVDDVVGGSTASVFFLSSECAEIHSDSRLNLM